MLRVRVEFKCAQGPAQQRKVQALRDHVVRIHCGVRVSKRITAL